MFYHLKLPNSRILPLYHVINLTETISSEEMSDFLFRDNQLPSINCSDLLEFAQESFANIAQILLSEKRYIADYGFGLVNTKFVTVVIYNIMSNTNVLRISNSQLDKLLLNHTKGFNSKKLVFNWKKEGF